MNYRAYAGAVAAVGLAIVVTQVLQPWMGPSISLFFFPAIVIVAMYGGYGPSLMATVLSAASVAFFFIQPRYSFDIGADDALRLAAFATVAVFTASLSAARQRAEEARGVLEELHHAVEILRKVSGWPTFVDAGLDGGSQKLLAHAATVVGCVETTAAWEADDEPSIYVARSTSASASAAIERRAPTDMPPSDGDSDPDGPTLACVTPHGEHADASAPFELAHLKGRVYFIGLPDGGRRMAPLVDVVAREVGNSLEQLYHHDRLQRLARREDRIRVARDLHDGVLQSLTGIRFQLLAFADAPADPSVMRDHLFAMERALAIEQRELRRFIDDLKPPARRLVERGGVADALEEMRDRLGAEWQTPVTVRVTPPDLQIRPEIEAEMRMMVREAAVNALKHANPSRVSIDVQRDGDRAVRVIVANDGRGFPFRGRMTHDALVASDAAPVTLRERIETLGGTLTIESAATGSIVEIVLPDAQAPPVEVGEVRSKHGA